MVNFYSAFSPPPLSFSLRLCLLSPFVLQLLLQCIVAKSVELYYVGYRLLRISDCQQCPTKLLHAPSHCCSIAATLLLSCRVANYSVDCKRGYLRRIVAIMTPKYDLKMLWYYMRFLLALWMLVDVDVSNVGKIRKLCSSGQVSTLLHAN